MPIRIAVRSSAARERLRFSVLIAAVAAISSCNDSNGPRTGKLSLTVQGLPTGTAAEVALTGPANFSRVLTGTEVVANLPPGVYGLKAVSVFNGAARYTALPDSQEITITKSDTPLTATVNYLLSTGGLTVTVGGIPSGGSAAVRVTGPRGFNRTIAATTTFEGLDTGTYSIFAQEIVANQHRFASSQAVQSVPVQASLTPATASVNYAQTTGTLKITVGGLPTGVAANVVISGPAGYTVNETSDLIGVRAGQYTITAGIVASGGTSFVPNSLTQTANVVAGGETAIAVNYSASTGPLNLAIDGVTLTQVVQTYSGTVPLISGRDAFIRVFGRASQQNEAATQVRIRFYQGEALVHTLTLQRSGGVPLVPDQASLSSSWNGLLLAQYVQPGLRMIADIDPANTVVEASESDNSFPATGAPAAVDVRDVSPLRITLVPIQQRFDKSLVGNVTDENKEQFLGDVRRMLPIRELDATIHAQYTTSDSLELTSNDGNNEWLRVLGEMNALRIAESSTRHYYGIVKVSYNSGVAGYGYVPGRAAVGWDYLPSGRGVTAHELTHNFGRFHAPCGGVGGPDPSYPYPGGQIGAFGYDLTTSTLKPSTAIDLMGYCSNPWISDYNYVGAMNWRASNAATSDAVGAALGLQENSSRPSLLVWGRVERGKLVLEPAFSVVARPSVPREGGAYRIEGVARNGRTLFSYSFAGEQPADAEDVTARHFAFAIPMDEAVQNELASIRLSGGGGAAVTMQASLAPDGVAASVNTVEATTRGGGSVNVRWGGQAARMALIRDRRTGQILSFARGGSANVRSSTGDLEVVLSDGVRSAKRQIRAGAR